MNVTKVKALNNKRICNNTIIYAYSSSIRSRQVEQAYSKRRYTLLYGVINENW